MDEPTPEQWRELHAAFRQYCEAAPWELFDDSDIVTMQHPALDHRGHCVVVSAGGVEYGLGVYRGDEGLADLLGAITGAFDPESPEILDYTNTVTALLADRELLHQEDRNVIRSLGLRYRGRSRWPLFQSAQPGFVPWRLNSGEADFQALSLQCITDLTRLVSQSELSLDSNDGPGLYLVRKFNSGGWKDEWEPLLFPFPSSITNYPDYERLRQLLGTKQRISGTLELSISHVHVPLQLQIRGCPLGGCPFGGRNTGLMGSNG